MKESTAAWLELSALAHLPIVAKCVLLWLAIGNVTLAQSDEAMESSVGMAKRIEQLKLPGSELEAIPVQDREQPIVLRIVASFPHGTDFRYDLEYYGLEPGTFDLRDYLRRVDGTAKDDLPELKVTISPVLPPGQVLPNELAPNELPKLGGYRQLLIIGSIIWIVVLALLVFWRPGGSAKGADELEQPLSVTDRLRRFAEEARDGTLTPDRHAEMEHLLLAHWRKKLDVAELSPSKAIAALRDDAEAGELLRTLERWLHSPEGPDDLDIEALLRPYESESASTTP